MFNQIIALKHQIQIRERTSDCSIQRKFFFYRKSIGGGAFFANSSTGYFSRDTPQIRLDLMTQISNMYHDWGLRKWVVTHTDFEYYI
jgi:hypothetical protein